MKKADIKKIVRQGYAKIAVGSSLVPSGAQRHAPLSSSCCGPSASGCGCPPSGRGLAAAGGCGTSSAKSLSKTIGYSDKEMKSVPSEANLGLGCGNPIALASLKLGETVLDLGSGPGLDCGNPGTHTNLFHPVPGALQWVLPTITAQRAISAFSRQGFGMLLRQWG